MPIKVYYVCTTCSTHYELDDPALFEDLVSWCRVCHKEICRKCKLTCASCEDTICMRCIETACVVQADDPIRCRRCAMQGAA